MPKLSAAGAFHTPARRIDQTVYHVIADDQNFPPCLVGRPDDPVREDRRRVELDALHQRFDGPQRVHFAVSVRCLG
jgi:hypothetical protein